MWITSTHFGRYAKEIQDLVTLASKNSFINVLNFGPGLGEPEYYYLLKNKKEHLASCYLPKFTWEPLEIANALSIAGIDFHIKAVDPSYNVVSNLMNQSEIIIEYHPQNKEDYYPTEQYYDGFLPGAQRRPLDNHIHRIYASTFQHDFKGCWLTIPDSIHSKISVELDELEEIERYKNEFDAIFCKNVSPYLANRRQSLRLFSSALKQGGFLHYDVSTDNPSEYGLEIISKNSDDIVYKKN